MMTSSSKVISRGRFIVHLSPNWSRSFIGSSTRIAVIIGVDWIDDEIRMVVADFISDDSRLGVGDDSRIFFSSTKINGTAGIAVILSINGHLKRSTMTIMFCKLITFLFASYFSFHFIFFDLMFVFPSFFSSFPCASFVHTIKVVWSIQRVFHELNKFRVHQWRNDDCTNATFFISDINKKRRERERERWSKTTRGWIFFSCIAFFLLLVKHENGKRNADFCLVQKYIRSSDFPSIIIKSFLSNGKFVKLLRKTFSYNFLLLLISYVAFFILVECFYIVCHVALVFRAFKYAVA